MAIDLGASEAKCYCGVLDGAHLTISEIYRFKHEPVSLWLRDKNSDSVKTTFWDDATIIKGMIDCLKHYRKDVSDQLSALSIDAWGTDGQLVTEDRELYGRILSYRDSQPVNLGPDAHALDEHTVYSITGIPSQKYNIRNRLHWFAQNRPETKSQIFAFLPVPTIFSCYLGAERKIDHTWAGVTQLMDIEKKQWSRLLVDSLNLPGLTLPQIVSPGTVIGRLHAPLADMVSLNAAPIIATASHDTAAAFYSSSVKPDGSTLIISSGTWSLVGKIIPEPVLSSDAQELKMSNQLGPDHVHFIRSITGLWILQALQKEWLDENGLDISWEEMIRMAERSEPFSALIDPDHKAFFNPERMTVAIDAFCAATDQPPPTDKGVYVRTVFESLAIKYRWINDQISNLSDTKTEHIRILGGGSRNHLLNQFTADCMGVPVSAGPVQASAIGNLLLQAHGLGISPSHHGIVMPDKQPATFDIRNREGWDAAYERFLKLVEFGQ